MLGKGFALSTTDQRTPGLSAMTFIALMQTLRQTEKMTYKDWNGKMNLRSLHLSAERWYDFNVIQRDYHNWEHANSVVSALPHWAPDSVVLAAYWHDAVYVPGAQHDANENASAAALALSTREYTDRKTRDIIDEAVELIKCTTINWHLNSTNIRVEKMVELENRAMLLDADISSLAAPFEKFLWNQRHILTENGLEWTKENVRKSSDFLLQFTTCREFIYHTDYARGKWERDAYANIMRYKTFAQDF